MLNLLPHLKYVAKLRNLSVQLYTLPFTLLASIICMVSDVNFGLW